MIKLLFAISLLALMIFIFAEKENFKSDNDRKKLIKYSGIATLVFFILFNIQSCFNIKTLNDGTGNKIKIEENNIKEENINKDNGEVEQREISKEENYDGITDIKEENIKELKDIDIINITPMKAFNKLYEIINKAKDI